MRGCGSCALGAVAAPACTDDAFEAELDACVDKWSATNPVSEICDRYIRDDAYADQIDTLPFCDEVAPFGRTIAIGVAGIVVVGFLGWLVLRRA